MYILAYYLIFYLLFPDLPWRVLLAVLAFFWFVTWPIAVGLQSVTEPDVVIYLAAAMVACGVCAVVAAPIVAVVWRYLYE